MQIIIDEQEIQEALNDYCTKQVNIPPGKKIKVDFTVGRGANSTRATIDFEDIEGREDAKELNETFTPADEKNIIARVEEANKEAPAPTDVKKDTKPENGTDAEPETKE